jgi:hypothetical protein
MGVPTGDDPKPVPGPPVGAPPSKAAFCFICSIRGSYRNSQVWYVVCSFSSVIDVPVFELPIPTIGAPPPAKLVADWLPIPPNGLEPPGLVEPGELEPPGPDVVGDVVGEELPGIEPPIELVAPGPVGEVEGAELVPPTVAVGWDDAIEAAEPSPPAVAPGSPASGWPKKPLTVVFASPTWISRQSDLPVIGSAYFCRRNRVLFDFSSCSMLPG